MKLYAELIDENGKTFSPRVDFDLNDIAAAADAFADELVARAAGFRFTEIESGWSQIYPIPGARFQLPLGKQSSIK